ncbi:MAG TPA: hypothetical protein P5069_01685 [Candidatus Hydrogenedentes bacterium]|nr:hypothetical protein [Candidatus Hydrogenedentota bacterium]HOH50339.1 hypothetical protein [Candidatus Hydrogenedentota bacterium]HRZ81135.1 hypothetical protein [Candidatus Hydrogenedentota bacterium]
MEDVSARGGEGRAGRLAAAAVLAALALAAQFALRPGIFAGETVNSRLATVYSLAHDHTWRIDRPPEAPPNPFEQTVDRVRVNGRILSSKPPLLPMLMTAEYAVLRAAAGWDLADPDTLRPFLVLVIFTLCQLPFAAAVVLFAAALRFLVPGRGPWLFLVAAFTFATPLFGYASQLNNHVPAVAALCACFYVAAGAATGGLTPSWPHFLLYGFCWGLAFAFDLPSAVFPALLSPFLLLRGGVRAAFWMGAGLLPPLAAHFGMMFAATGSLMPVQTRPEVYMFEESLWRHPLGIDGLNEPRGVYLFHAVAGRFGVFSLFPVTLLGLCGAGAALRGRGRPAFVWACLAAFIVLTAYYVASTNNYGGASYGFRWHLCAVPALLLMAPPLFARPRGALFWAAAALLCAVSLYSSWECLQAPWGVCHEWTCRWVFGPAV